MNTLNPVNNIIKLNTCIINFINRKKFKFYEQHIINNFYFR